MQQITKDKFQTLSEMFKIIIEEKEKEEKGVWTSLRKYYDVDRILFGVNQSITTVNKEQQERGALYPFLFEEANILRSIIINEFCIIAVEANLKKIVSDLLKAGDICESLKNPLVATLNSETISKKLFRDLFTILSPSILWWLKKEGYDTSKVLTNLTEEELGEELLVCTTIVLSRTKSNKS